MDFRKLANICKTMQVCMSFAPKNEKNCFLLKFWGKITSPHTVFFQSQICYFWPSLLYKFTVFLIISTLIHKTPPIPFGRKLNAAKQNGKGKLVIILRVVTVIVIWIKRRYVNAKRKRSQRSNQSITFLIKCFVFCFVHYYNFNVQRTRRFYRLWSFGPLFIMYPGVHNLLQCTHIQCIFIV